MKEPQTLWEAEEKKRRREKLLADRGLTRKDVRIVQGATIKNLTIPGDELLRSGGYRATAHGWVKPFESIYRYHAFVLPGNIVEIHTDKIKTWKNGKVVHIASAYMCKEEKKRLRALLPPSKNQIKAKQNRKYKNEVLPREKLLEALAEIKKNAQ